MPSTTNMVALVLLALALLGGTGGLSSADVEGPPDKSQGVGSRVTKPESRVDAIRADAGTTVLVQTALMRDLRFLGRRLGVEALEGLVILRGKIDSSASKAAAAEIARSVPGVKSIRNELQVVPPAQRAEVDARDREIGRALDDRLKRDPQLASEKIDVRVDAGLVTLTGGRSGTRISAPAPRWWHATCRASAP